jgi:Cys-tRNA(Pro)/Cys-tRNA(Cys) deacylase
MSGISGSALHIVHDGVRATLARSGCPYQVHNHAHFSHINGPADVARALAIEPERIAKTLLFVEQGSARRFALLSCSWNARADVKTLGLRIGYGRLEVASARALTDVLGCSPGGVSPLGAPEGVIVALDEALFAFPTILIGGGMSGIDIELAPNDLATLTGAIVGRFARPSS